MTIKQIAELAGTSRGTVDRVLNDRGNVNSELRERILAIAEREQYHPNKLAQALTRSRQLHIGVVIHSVGNPFFEDVLRGVQECAAKLASYGVTLTLRQLKGYDTETQLHAVRELVSEGIDGLALTPIDVPEVGEYLSSLTIPIVTFNTDIEIDRLAFVGCDYYNSGMIAGDVAHMMLRTGGKIAVVIGSTHIRGHMERVQGLQHSLERCPGVTIDAILENQDDESTSYDVVQRYLRQSTPDLVWFAAAGVDGGMRAIAETAPDVCVLAVDDTQTVRRYMEQGAISATVTQEPYAQGNNAIHILYEYLSEGKRPAETHCYTHNQIRVYSSGS